MPKQNSSAGNQLPSLFSCEKKLVFSDGYMYGTTWEERKTRAIPLHLKEKSVRGTMSHFEKNAAPNDSAKLNHNREDANLQTIDSCFLPMGCDTLKLEYTVKVLGGLETPSACNNPAFEAKYREIVEKYIKESGFQELSRRYAANLANARSLWRNRIGAEKIEVVIKEKVGTETRNEWTFNAYDFPLRNFENLSGVSELENMIAKTLCANSYSEKYPFLLLKVEIFALLGEGQEVYPSEEIIPDKDADAKKKNDKFKKSKILYHVSNAAQEEDIAAMHSQKIGNAIRTIDTWYPRKENDSNWNENYPIAIETYGAVTNRGDAFRRGETKKDFYTLLKKYVQDGKLDNEIDEHYVMAVFVRGGVFSEKE